MTTPRFGFVVEYVSDIEGARRFYEDVVGLQVQREHPTFVQFDKFAIASDEALSGGEPEVYWLVDDAETSFQQISPRAEVLRPLQEMPFGKVFSIKDPAGHPLFMLQLSQNRPSTATV